MTVAPTQKRKVVKAERDDEALGEITEGRSAWLDEQLRMARLFHRVDVKQAFWFAGCSSVAEFASLRGYDGRHVDQLVLLGYGLAARPELEGLLREKKIGFPSACALGVIDRAQYRAELFEDGCPAVDEKDDWTRWAQFERLRDLKRRIRERMAEVKIARGVVPTASEGTRYAGGQVTTETADDFARAQGVASRKAGQALSRGEFVSVMVTDYLLNNDPEAETPGTRRMPPTVERMEDRGIPAEVKREILLRSGGQCEFGACPRPGTEFCHRTPHADGSAREVEDLFHGCHGHHRAYDGGRIRFLGWTPDRRPTFIVDGASDVLHAKPRPRRRRFEGLAEWVVKALSDPAKRRLRKIRKRAEAEQAAHVAADGAAEGAAGGEGADLIRDAVRRHGPPPPRPSAERHCDDPYVIGAYAERAREPLHSLLR